MIKQKKLIITILLFGCIILGSGSMLEATAGSSEQLSTIVQRVEKNVSAISRLVILISYVAGVGFSMAGILQFKAHKDNPTQVPLSKPIVFVCVGAFLIFLPNLIGTGGKTIFNTDSAPTTGGGFDISSVTPDA